MTKEQYLEAIFKIAAKLKYTVELNRDGLRQIDFGHKKLHEGHLEKLYPDILKADAHLPTLIEMVAPGRPCAHRPMREIIEEMTRKFFDSNNEIQIDAMRRPLSV